MYRSRDRLAAVLLVAFASLLLIASSASAAPSAPRTESHRHGPRHIFYIMMENHGYSEIIGNRADAPFVNRLAERAGVATDYYGVTHPSLPNYLAAISGNFQGIWDDCQAGAAITCPPEEFIPTAGDGTTGNYLTPAEIASASATPHLFAGANIVDQLQAHHVTWRAYMQGLPSAGSEVVDAPTVETSTGPEALALYVQKHNPFMYFSDINYPGSPRLHEIVPLHRLASNLRSGHVPNFVWISPDTCHDMHGIDPASAALIGLPSCGYPASGLDHGAIRLGDRFLQRTVRMITHSRTWRTTRSSIVITWDEDDYSGFSGTSTSPVGVGGVILGGAQVPTIVLNSRGSHHHRVFDQSANHYNLLATIERMWHLGCLANTCSIPQSQLLTPLFR